MGSPDSLSIILVERDGMRNDRRKKYMEQRKNKMANTVSICSPVVRWTLILIVFAMISIVIVPYCR